MFKLVFEKTILVPYEKMNAESMRKLFFEEG